MSEAAVIAAPTPGAENQTNAAPPSTVAVHPEAAAWRSSLSDDIRGDATLGKYNDVGALAKAHIELTKKLGTPTLPKPQQTWTEKEWGDLHSALGRPDKPDGYGFKPLEKVPEGMRYAPEQDKWFSETAHKMGLNTAQASGMREAFVAFQVQQAAGLAEQSVAQKAALEEGTRKLQMEYGTKWDAAIDGAQRVVNEFGSPELKELLQSTGLHEHPAVVGFIAKLGQTMLDHSVITGIPRISGSFNAGPAAAQAELAKMDSDPEVRKALVKASHPQHDALVKKRADLMRSMVPVPDAR
jgi:hypothetical protein